MTKKIYGYGHCQSSRKHAVHYCCWANNGYSGGPVSVYGFTCNGLTGAEIRRRAAKITGCKPSQIKIEETYWME